MNERWIDTNLEHLYRIIGPFEILRPEFVYAQYTGSIPSLQKTNKIITNHIGIKVNIEATFTQGSVSPGDIKMEKREEYLGGVSVGKYVDLYIKVSSEYRNNVHAIGAILAHENAHAYLFLNEIPLSTNDLENEMFTDLTAVVLGLGELMLNGINAVKQEHRTSAHSYVQTITFGYLEPRLIRYAYNKMKAIRNTYPTPPRVGIGKQTQFPFETYINRVYNKLKNTIQDVIKGSQKVVAKLKSNIPQIVLPKFPVHRVRTRLTGRLIAPNGKTIDLIAAARTIGRQDFFGILSSGSLSAISREHCAIFIENGKFYVRDDRSTNGTKLNGKEIRGKGKFPLFDGDKIEIANVIVLKFTIIKL